MKKKLLPLAIAAAMAPGFATAADVSGFVDIIYTIADDQASGVTTPSQTEGKFTAEGEVDVSASPADGVTVRMDVDLVAGSNDVELEQAFFAWGATEGVTVLGGVFNNPIGMESEDAPEWWGTNSGVIRNLLDGQTALHGNNVAGLAVAGDVGPATVTAALLNDLANSDEENSFALVVNASPVDGLDLELGFVTSADQADSANATAVEGVTDFNASYMIPGVDGLSVGLDYLVGGAVVDSAYEFMINYSMGDFGAGVRLEAVSWEAGGDDSERTTIHGSYQVASNLVAILEIADGDDANVAGNAAAGIETDSLTTLELIATF